MRRMMNALKPRLMNLLFVAVYVAALVAVYMDVFVWRP